VLDRDACQGILSGLWHTYKVPCNLQECSRVMNLSKHLLGSCSGKLLTICAGLHIERYCPPLCRSDSVLEWRIEPDSFEFDIVKTLLTDWNTLLVELFNKFKCIRKMGALTHQS
jgi:hypothetical protein